MNYLESIEKIWRFLKPLSKYKQSFHFAYWIVPMLVGFCWYAAIETQDLKNNITIIPLKSSIDQNKQILSKTGFLIITNGLQEEFKIPLKENALGFKTWTSLDDSILKLNDDRISTSNNIFKLDMPLYAESHTLGLVVEGNPKGELNMPGKTILLSDFLPISNVSILLVLSVFCAIAFGFGLIFNEFSKIY